MLGLEVGFDTLGTVVIIGGIIVGVLAFVSDNRRKELISTLQDLYEAQKAATQQSEEAREHEHRECNERISALEGQVSAMQSSWIRSVAEGVASAVERKIDEVIHEAEQGRESKH